MFKYACCVHMFASSMSDDTSTLSIFIMYPTIDIIIVFEKRIIDCHLYLSDSVEAVGFFSQHFFFYKHSSFIIF